MPSPVGQLRRDADGIRIFWDNSMKFLAECWAWSSVIDDAKLD